MNIIEAISQLTPDDYIDGLPKLSAVQKLTGDKTIRARDIMQAMADQIIDLHPWRQEEAADLGEAIREEAAEPVVEELRPLPPDATDDPHEALRIAERNLDLARAASSEAAVTVKRHRAVLAAALVAWTASGPIITPEQAARDFIRQGIEERAARAARRTQRRIGSAVDAMAQATAGGSYRAGGGFAYKRGAMSLAQSQAKLNEIARAKAVAGEGKQ